ncbi:MAG: YaiO family outer membrane beta-barrel protein [Rhodospirillaceae bacterium]
MVFPRHVVAAATVAALLPLGDVRSEPTARSAAYEPDATALATTAQGYYRGSFGQRRDDDRATFGISAAVTPGVAPGTTAWLTRQPLEPLSSSYASPYAARKEAGISYSSDGRVNAYLAERARPAAAGDPAHMGGVDCCMPDPASTPPGSHYAKAESPEVASLLGRLKTKGLKLALDDGWKLTAGARSREYSNSVLNSRVGHITLQRWFGEWSTAYSMQFEKRGGWNLAPSQSLQLGYALAPRSTVGVAYTTGQELAFFGPQGMLKTDVRALSLQAEHAVEKNWSLRFDAGYYDHGELPSHKTIRIGFRRSLW